MKASDVLNGDYVAIEWIDSSSYPGWRFTESECEFSVPEVLTVGRLYKNYKDFLAIVLNYGKEDKGNPEQVNGVIAIPKSAIKKIYNITEIEEVNVDHWRLIDNKCFKEDSGIKYISTSKCVKDTVKSGDGISIFSYSVEKVKEVVLNDFSKKVFNLCCEKFGDNKQLKLPKFRGLNLYSELKKYEKVEGDENVKSEYPTLRLSNVNDGISEYMEKRFEEYFIKEGFLYRSPNAEEISTICGGGEFPFLYAYVNKEGEVLYRLIR